SDSTSFRSFARKLFGSPAIKYAVRSSRCSISLAIPVLRVRGSASQRLQQRVAERLHLPAPDLRYSLQLRHRGRVLPRDLLQHRARHQEARIEIEILRASGSRSAQALRARLYLGVALPAPSRRESGQLFFRQLQPPPDRRHDLLTTALDQTPSHPFDLRQLPLARWRPQTQLDQRLVGDHAEGGLVSL